MDLLKANAWLDGRSTVESDDMLVYSNVLWDKPEDRAKCASLVGKLVNPAITEMQEHYDAVKACIRELSAEMSKPESNSGTVLEYYKKVEAQVKKMKKLKAGSKGDAMVVKAEKEVKAAFARMMGARVES